MQDKLLKINSTIDETRHTDFRNYRTGKIASAKGNRAYRVGELRKRAGDAGNGIRPHEQVRRRLSGEALLRRLRSGGFK